MTDTSTDSRAARWFGRVLGPLIFLVIGAVPIALDRDSYPLSTYPMFSSRRTAVEPVHTAVLVDVDGNIDRLSPTQISGNDEVIIAAQLVYRSIGRDGGAVLCNDIARRVQDPQNEGATIEIVTEKYDAIAWYEGRRFPISRVVHSSCRVPEVVS